jgi:hypothetical protein
MMDKGFSENENVQTGLNFDVSTSVNPAVQFPNHFIPDLIRLANLLIA